MTDIESDMDSLSIVDTNKGRRLSRASVKFFQTETSTRNLSLGSTTSTAISTRNLVAGLEGIGLRSRHITG